MSALSDWRAAVIARVGTISGYAEAPGGDPTQIPEHWAAGYIVQMPSWTAIGQGATELAVGSGVVELWYRADQMAYEGGEWMSAWEALRSSLEATGWTGAGAGVIRVTSADTRLVADRFVGVVGFDWTLTYARA